MSESATVAAPVDPIAGPGGIPEGFDETAYLTAFPKLAENIRAGFLKSGLDHYLRIGINERRLQLPKYRKALSDQSLLARLSNNAPPQDLAPAVDHSPAPTPRPYIASGLDTLLVAWGGLCLAIGWVDDRGLQFSGVSLVLPDGREVFSNSVARCRRADAESAIGCPPGHLLGFYALITLGQNEPPGPGSSVHLLCGGEPIVHPARPHFMEAGTLRDAAFEYLAAATYFGAPSVESFLQLDRGIGTPLLELSRTLSSQISRQAHVERHGRHDRHFRASIVVCLYGRIEYLFLQAAAFSASPNARDYEYVYVCNSPELIETLQRETRIAARLYDMAFTLVLLPGNAGFGAANNAAANYAASDRVLILNPDVFPRDTGWARRHNDLVEALPADQTRLWGAPLYYDDGSLMHGGMFVTTDVGLSVKPSGIVRQELLRVEHYGKGAPPETALYRQSRRVPAVTGAFMSIDRTWFEKIGGFSEEYVFGHYEDADLCLKTWYEGGAVWMHDFPLWHLEGKGSIRKPAHEGGSMINRWHFTRTWLDFVQDGFSGPTPARLDA